MKALMYVGPEKVEIQDIPTPQLQPNQVLLKIAATGICGSDVHGFLGHSERRKPGLILGHEAVASDRGDAQHRGELETRPARRRQSVGQLHEVPGLH